MKTPLKVGTRVVDRDGFVGTIRTDMPWSWHEAGGGYEVALPGGVAVRWHSELAAVPDITAGNREIPAGKVLLAECGSLEDGAQLARHTVLTTKLGWGRQWIRLEAVSPGWAIAGSMMRWDNGHFGVFWDIDGSRHGSRYQDVGQASEHFRKIPRELY